MYKNTNSIEIDSGPEEEEVKSGRSGRTIKKRRKSIRKVGGGQNRGDFLKTLDEYTHLETMDLERETFQFSPFSFSEMYSHLFPFSCLLSGPVFFFF